MNMDLKIQAVAFLTLCCGLVEAQVQFNFSASVVEISEAGNLASQLYITKTGKHEGNISIHVRVSSITPNINDYIPNDDHAYLFTKDTRQLPIQTQLRTDRSSEGIERFIISLLDPPLEMSPSIEIVFPSSVTVIIIDDDSVLIGFADSNMSVAVIEGNPPQTVYIGVKQEGLALDTFDTIPVNIQTTFDVRCKIETTEVEVVIRRLDFTRAMMLQFTTISAPDNDVSDGTRSAQLCINEDPESIVPTEFYPGSIPVQVIDNDVTIFRIIPQAPLSVVEGDMLPNVVKILKSNNTILTYTVALMVEGLTSSSDLSDLIVTETNYTFDPSITEKNIQLQAQNNFIFSEGQKEFLIRIIAIEAVNTTGALTTVEGAPLTVIVYNNDFEVGFTENQISVNESTSSTACIQLFGTEDNGIIGPTQNIELKLSLIPSTSGSGTLQLDMSTITLNATVRSACFEVTFSPGSEYTEPGNFIIQLSSLSRGEYNVTFLQQNLAIITIKNITFQSSISGGTVAAIIIVCIVILIAAVTIITVILLYKWRKSISVSLLDNCLPELSKRKDGSRDSRVEDPLPQYKNNIVNQKMKKEISFRTNL